MVAGVFTPPPRYVPSILARILARIEGSMHSQCPVFCCSSICIEFHQSIFPLSVIHLLIVRKGPLRGSNQRPRLQELRGLLLSHRGRTSAHVELYMNIVRLLDYLCTNRAMHIPLGHPVRSFIRCPSSKHNLLTDRADHIDQGPV